LDHFHNPRNVGSLEDANLVVRAGDPSCGDALVFFLKIENDIIRLISSRSSARGFSATPSVSKAEGL